MLRFNKNFRYIVFDVESESLNLEKSRPWQLSWLVCERDKVVETHDYRIKLPNFAMSAGARRVTRFNDNEYERLAVDAKGVWDKFTSYLYDPDCYNVGHNILGFDVYQINNLARMLGVDMDFSYVERCIDTLSLAKAAHLNDKPPKFENDEERVLWQYRFVDERCRGAKLTLSALATSYGIEFDKERLHDGLYDIQLNQKVFWKQVYEIEI